MITHLKRSARLQLLLQCTQACLEMQKMAMKSQHGKSNSVRLIRKNYSLVILWHLLIGVWVICLKTSDINTSWWILQFWGCNATNTRDKASRYSYWIQHILRKNVTTMDHLNRLQKTCYGFTISENAFSSRSCFRGCFLHGLRLRTGGLSNYWPIRKHCSEPTREISSLQVWRTPAVRKSSAKSSWFSL